jgi:molybdopterin-guanine dinucleotide biosynthesis protein A
MHFTTIILAGGQSSRMGSNKALIPYRGKPLIQYSIDLALQFTREIIISANNHDLDYLGIQVVTDHYKIKASLAGIHAGLTASQTDWNLVLTCDMPNLTKELINRLLSELADGFRMIVPLHDGFLEPLCGFYHRSLLPRIEYNIEAGKFSLLDLPGFAPHKFVPMEDQSEATRFLFKNVNEKIDLLT